MSYTIQTSSFEGPLDLLLRLIERSEIDITSIALAQVADQYLAHVRALEAPDPAALSEFLLVAARLLLIKSRALLPQPTAPGNAAIADDPLAEDLAEQLRAYQRYKQAATLLRGRSDQQLRLFVRLAAPLLPANPPQQLDVSVDGLVSAVQRRLKLLQSLQGEPTPLPMPRRLTVSEVSAEVRERLGRRDWFDFEDLLSLATTRQEVIVTLWAVLELLKRQVVTVEQHELFGPIAIGRGSAFE